MILTPNPQNVDKFDFDQGKFSAYISDLGPSFKFERVYDDACDAGFSIDINCLAGNIVVFRMETVDANEEGDIEGWHFQAIKPSNLKYLKALIIND